MKLLKNNKGSMLILSYFVIVALIGMGAAFALLATNDGRLSEINKDTIGAYNAAEAGIERAIYDIRQECVNNLNDPDLADGSINSMSIGPNTAAYYSVSAYNGNSINGGSYAVSFKNVASDDRAMWIKSVGTVDGITQTQEAYVKVFVASPWHTAIFGGAGESSTVINGDFNAYGTIHLLGSAISSSDNAMDIGGSAYVVGNNYASLAGSLSVKIPSLGTVEIASETVSTLEANAFVKNGLVSLNGSGTLGIAQATGNSIKETLDGVYVSDGFAGTQGTSNVYSDNGYTTSYPFGSSLSFPSTTEIVSAPSTTFAADLKANSLVISDSSSLSELASIDPTSSFTFTDALNGYGSISMDGSGNMAISGKVYIQGGSFNIDTQEASTTITYTGTGVVYAESGVEIKANLLTNGNSSFPTNIMGIMTPNTITFNRSGIDVMGLFYAEDQITVNHSLDLVGTMVSNYFDFSANGPTVYQVPNAANSVPAGMITTDSSCFIDVVSWNKVSS